MKHAFKRPVGCVLILALAFALALAPVNARPTSACTAFQLRSADGAHVYFRSMEFGFPFNSELLVIPRGTAYTGTAPNGKSGLT